MRDVKPILTAITGFSCFAVTDVILKYLQGALPVQGTAFFVAIFAVVGLLAFSPLLGGIKNTLLSKKKKWHVMRSFAEFITLLLMIFALQNMAIAKVYTLVFLYPLLTVIFGRLFFGEKASSIQYLSVVIGFCGALVILRPGMIAIDMAALAAIGVAILAAITNHILVRLIGKGETHLSFGLYPYLLTIVAGGLLWLPHSEMPARNVLLLLALAGLFNAGGMLFVSLSFSRARAATVAPFAYIQMLGGIFLSYLFLNDIADLWTLTGASIIIAAGLLKIISEPSQS